jgi:hypothetical protein
MASPKRSWPPNRETEGETAAAFEAAVAVVKASVARSGEVLSSAKEDLNDHQRWLKAQAAAVESDRERLAKWLQRQRERQEAHERREQTRARRSAKRQAVVHAVRDRIAGALFAVRAGVLGTVAAVTGGLNAIDSTAANGLRWIGHGLRNATFATVATVQHAGQASGRSIRGGVLFAASGVAAGAARAGSQIQRAAPALGNVAARGYGLVAASRQRVSDAIGPRAEESVRRLAGRAGTLSRVARETLAPVLSSAAARAHALAPTLSDRAGAVTRAAGETIAPILASAAARAQALAPSLSGRMAAAGAVAGAHLRRAGDGARSLLARPETSAEAGENALSLPNRIGRLDLSQMLIIAGALLLVSGALMLGGGFLLRGGKPEVAAASTTEPIAWLFEHGNLALEERSVFTFITTPEGLRVTGFAIGGVNMSERNLDAVTGVIKPDNQAKDIKLAMQLIPAEGQPGEITTLEPGAPGAIAPQEQFALVFAFPENGVPPDRVLSEFGGVMLRVRYQDAGTEKSFIQYLSPAFLEQQLAEITGAAKGS